MQNIGKLNQDDYMFKHIQSLKLITEKYKGKRLDKMLEKTSMEAINKINNETKQINELLKNKSEDVNLLEEKLNNILKLIGSNIR